MGVVWIASYPKSGNTWMRFLLCQYYFGEVGSSEDVNLRIPNIHHATGPLPDPGAARLFMKTHLAFSPRHPLANRTEACIHIVRHPKDVFLSALNFQNMMQGGERSRLLPGDTYAASYLRNGGDPLWVGAGFGTWEQHLQSWLSPLPFPRLTLKYEDLIADAPGVLVQVLRFVGDEADPARVAKAVEASTFDRMRALEVREKASDRTTLFRGSKTDMRRGLFFMNKGRSTGSLAHLDAELDAQFERRFGGPARLAGYDA